MKLRKIIGYTLGGICYLPSFICAIIISDIKNIWFGFSILCITQILWLISITLCVIDLENENNILKNKLKKCDEENK
jgi:hypothetical protein